MRRLLPALTVLILSVIMVAAQNQPNELPACTITNADLTSDQRLVLRNRHERVGNLSEIFNEFDVQNDELSELVFDLQWWAVFADSAYIRFPFEDIPQCQEYQQIEAVYTAIIRNGYAIATQYDIADYLLANPRIADSARENVGVARTATAGELDRLLLVYHELYEAISAE